MSLRVPTGVPNGSSSLPNGSIKHVNNSELPVDGVSAESKDDVAVDEKKSLTVPRHPILTFASVIRAEKEKSTSIPNAIPSSVRSASVSASDPVTCEAVSQQKGAESNDIQGNKNTTNDDDSKLTMHEKTVLTTSSSISEKEAESKSEVIEKNQPSEPPLVNHGSSLSIDEDLQQGYTAAHKGIVFFSLIHKVKLNICCSTFLIFLSSFFSFDHGFSRSSLLFNLSFYLKSSASETGQ